MNIRLARLFLALAAIASLRAQIIVTTSFEVNGRIKDGAGSIQNSQTIDIAFDPSASVTELKTRLEIAAREGSAFNGDLYATLAHQLPDGTPGGAVTLLNRPGVTGPSDFGYSDNGLNVTFTDAAAQNISTYRSGAFLPANNLGANGNLLGSFRPAINSLAVFNESTPNGTWRLSLEDRSPGGLHQLVSWDLQMKVSLSPGAVLHASNQSLEAGVAAQSISNPIELSGAVAAAGDLDLSFSGGISGPGQLIKKGSASLALTAANSFSGGARLESGTLAVGDNSSLGTGFFTIAGGTLKTLSGPKLIANQLNTSGEIVFAGPDPLDFTGNVELQGPQTWIVQNAITMGGNISGPASAIITKSGPGKLILKGANQFFGGIVLNAGSLGLGGDSTLGSGPLTLQTGGTLFAQDFARTATNSVTLDGDAVISGAMALTFTGPFTLNDHRSLIVSNTALTKLSGVISQTGGARAFVKDGPGVLQVTAANTYSGGTLIARGTLKVSNATGSGTGSGAVTLASGARLTGSGRISGALQINGIYAPGDSPGLGVTGSQVWNSGGVYEWEVNDANGAEGGNPGADLVRINGGLQINASPSAPFFIHLRSLKNLQAGPALNFFSDRARRWRILTTSFGIFDLTPGSVQIDSSEFVYNPTQGAFSLSVENANTELWLVYTPQARAAAIVQSASLSAGNFNCTFQGLANHAFNVYAADSLVSPDWKFVERFVSDTGTFSMTAPLNASQRFYIALQE